MQVLCVVVYTCRMVQDNTRHSALREAAVKPAASDCVFSLGDVRTVVRQELFSAQRGFGSFAVPFL